MKNKTCRLFGAARADHFTRIAKTVNASLEPERPWQSRSQAPNNGKCGRATRTLARESLRIVAFQSLGTTSRAAVLILSVLRLGVSDRERLACAVRAKGFCLQRIVGEWGWQKRGSQNAGATKREECDDGN